MKDKARTLQLEKIKDPLFLAGLVILLLNDFYLKYAFSNAFTGKLSDVAGLFIFPYFFSALWPQKSKLIYWITAAVFSYWKLPFSQSLIDFANNNGIAMNRTIDITDIWTLLILPLSFRYYRKINLEEGSSLKPITSFIAVVSVFSFCATTLPRKEVSTQAKPSKVFVLELSKKELFENLNYGHGYSDTLEKNLSDSLFYLYFDIPELRADVTALASINEINSNRTTVRLDSIVGCEITGKLFSDFDQDKIDKLNNLTSKEFENYFKKYFIEKVSKGKSDLFFDNKEIDDKYKAGELNN